MSTHQDIKHALFTFTSTFKPYVNDPIKSITAFSNGVPIAYLLLGVDNFNLKMNELELHSDKWVQKLTNLKKIILKIESYTLEYHSKTLKTKDIDLIQIAKHDSVEHISKLFELVIAVFMLSPQKEDYIQTIMNLDDRSQQALVVIVQNALDERINDEKQEKNQTSNQFIEEIQELNSQNEQLRTQIDILTKNNELLSKKNVQLHQMVQIYEEEIQKYKSAGKQNHEDNIRSQFEQLKTMNDNLKAKLMFSVRQHQEEIIKLREQNIFLQNKINKLKDFEEKAEHYKDQLDSILNDKGKSQEFQKEKKRFSKQIEEKDAQINQLKKKVEQMKQKYFSMEENQLNMKLELQKKQVKFQLLENQVKNRISDQLQDKMEEDASKLTYDAEQIEYLQQELKKMRRTIRQLERQNAKYKKKIENSFQLENQKKKLQKIIIDVSRAKDFQIQMLVVSLYDLRTENIKLQTQILALKAK